MSQRCDALLHPPFGLETAKTVRFFTPLDALSHPLKCAFAPLINAGRPYCIRVPIGVILGILFNPGGAA
jgi:hypothetical protein